MRSRTLAAAASLLATTTGLVAADDAASALQLPLPAKSVDCSSWNVTAGKVASPNPQFTKMYDLTGIPNIPPNNYPAGVASGEIDPCTIHSTLQPAGYCNAECGCDEDLAVEECSDANKWANTYDDGPSQYTQTVITTLKKYNDTKAMFFVIGGNVCQNQQQLINTVNAGHEVGVHTWSHPRLTSLKNEEIIAEIQYTEDIIFQLTGVRPKYMRPPFGNMDARVKFILDKMGYRAVHWNVDTNDWNFNYVPDTSANEAAASTSILGAVDKYIAASASAKNGTISLEHDIARIPTSLADSVLAKITAGGWEPVPITKCLNVASWIRGGDANTTTTTTGSPVKPATGPTATSKPGANSANALRGARALTEGALAVFVALTFAI